VCDNDAQHRPEPESVSLNIAAVGYSEMSDEAGYAAHYDQRYCFEYFSEDTTG
jgi:hypothetical protein